MALDWRPTLADQFLKVFVAQARWIEAKAAPRTAAKRRSTAAQTFGATMDDGAIVLGTIELGTKTVTLSVNSEARAARGRAMLEPVLAGLARAPSSSGRASNR